MKKSKIIIPAAAILALSVGASVTGTVAWFTAARTASFTGNNLAVVNAAGDLKVTLSAVTGCKVSTDRTSVDLTYLRDASFDGTDVYVADLSQDGTKIIGLSQAALGSFNKAKVKVGKKYTLKLKYAAGKKATVKKVTWKSSKKSVATVSSKGKVTAVKAGKATIAATITFKDGSKKKVKFTVTVK